MYCEIRLEGKRLCVAQLEAELHNYRPILHSALTFNHAGPLNRLKKAGQYSAKTIFGIKCVTNGDLPFFARLNSRFHGYVCYS